MTTRFYLFTSNKSNLAQIITFFCEKKENIERKEGKHRLQAFSLLPTFFFPKLLIVKVM